MTFIKTLERIADTMQVPLTYDQKVVPPLAGSRRASYAPLPGLTIPFTIRAEKLFHFDQTGVVFHVLGNLWALVAHYEKTNSTTVFLIDQIKMSLVADVEEGARLTPDKVIQHKFNLKEAVDMLRPAIVQSFIYKSGVWAKLPLPK